MTQKITIFILAAFGVLVSAVIFLSGRQTAVVPNKETPETETDSSSLWLEVQDLVIGSGEEAKAGDIILVHYVGTLQDGTKFDSSYYRGEPLKFTLGAGQVIKGWDEGLLGMKVGGKRRLVIPPELGYGARAVGSIPPNSTLIFEVELAEVYGE